MSQSLLLYNVVGFNTRTFQKNEFRLTGLPWQAVGGSFGINDIFKYSSTYELDWGMTPGEMETDLKAKAPQIQLQRVVKDAGGAEGTYRLFFYVKEAWIDDGSNGGEGSYKDGWCDKYGCYLSDDNPGASYSGDVIPGAGAWFKDPEHDAPVMTLAGEVMTEDVEVDCPADFRLRAPSIPMAMNVNNPEQVQITGLTPTYELDWGMTPGEMETDLKAKAPQIQVQKLGSTEYELYFFVKDAWIDDGSNGGEGSYKDGWCDKYGSYAQPGFGAVVDGNIPAGAAMWVRGCTNAFKMKFIAPTAE